MENIIIRLYAGLLSVYGVNFIFWGVVGFLRLVWEKLFGKRALDKQYLRRDRFSLNVDNVAVCVPAHNEALVIRATILSLKKLVKPQQIYIVSDGSTDDTAAIARGENCNVLENTPGVGKAGALERLLEHFKLYDRYELILFVDADTVIDPSYINNALPFFTNPYIVAIAGYARSLWPQHKGVTTAGFLVSYRSRMYTVIQNFFRFGQTWGRMNMTAIIPGFASMYRTRALRKMDLDPPGLALEDYNMTFEVHHQRLGIIAHHPTVSASTQDPDNWRDYIKQIKRWTLGFWQTVRRHGVWPSMFWFGQAIFLGEMVVANIFMLLSPFVLVGMVLTLFGGATEQFVTEYFLRELPWRITWTDIVIGVFAGDYLLTVIGAVVERRPKALLYGLGYLALRWLDALIFFYTFFLAFFVASDGRWKSPTRRTLTAK